MPFDHRPSFNSNDDKSNVGIPGLWIYEISQLPDIPYIRKPKRKVKLCGKSYAKPSSVAVFSASAKQISIECPGLVTKDQNWGGRSYEENLQVKLIGSSFNKTIDNSDIDFDIYSAKLTFDAPEFWGVNEVVGMSVTAEELEQKIEATLSFTQDQHSRPLEVSTVEGSGILQVSWPEATINETINLLYTEYAYNGMLIFKPRFFDNKNLSHFLMFYASWSKDSASLRIDSFNKRLLFLYSIVKPCRADLGFLSNGEVADFQKFFCKCRRK